MSVPGAERADRATEVGFLRRQLRESAAQSHPAAVRRAARCTPVRAEAVRSTQAAREARLRALSARCIRAEGPCKGLARTCLPPRCS